jgi:hypothetical protein
VSVALHGNLQDFGIGEVFQLIGQQRKTGVLEIEAGNRRVQLHFDAGSILRALPTGEHEGAALGEMLVRVGLLTRDRLEDLERARRQSLQPLTALLAERSDVAAADLAAVDRLLTRETIFEVLRWKDGSFHFSAHPVETDLEGAQLLIAEQVLMDGLRMVDEWQTFAHRVPREESVFQRAGRFDDHRAAHSEDTGFEKLERVFQLVDGRLSARRIIDLSRLGTFEGTRLLAELRDLGLIELLDPDKVAPRRSRVPRAVLPENPGRLAFSTLLPLCLLAAVAILTHRGQATVGAPELRVSTDPVVQARVELSTRRLRNALDAHRYARGRLPDSLERLVESGFVERGALADPEGRPYYYALHGETYVLLAPGS